MDMDDAFSRHLAGILAPKPTPAPDPNRKRLHISTGMQLGGEMTTAIHGLPAVKRMVSPVWSAFGKVTDDFYPENLSYCFLSFGSHAEAAAAMEGINNPERLRAAVEQAVQSQTVEATRDIVKRLTDHFFATGVNEQRRLKGACFMGCS